MRQIFALVCLASMAIGYSARENLKPGIHGTIDPPEGGAKVWAINGADSFSTIPVSGRFSIETRPGNWLLLVEGIAPYKNTTINTVLVLENQSTDVGVVKMNR